MYAWGVVTTIDQYALAVMTRYVFTGCPPRALGNQGIYTPLTELNPGRLKSKEIDNIVLRALSIEPDHRFPNVLDFAKALEAAVQETDHSDFYNGITVPSPPMQPEPGHQPPPEVFPDIPIQRVPPRKEPVNKPLPIEIPPNKVVPRLLSSLPIFPLRPLFSKELPSQPSMLSWSPDGTLLACTFHKQEAPWLVRMDNKIEIAQILRGTRHACWSPDGRLLAVSMNNGARGITKICLWSIERPTEEPVTLCSHNTPAIDGLDWSSNGQLAVWVEHQILLYTVPQQVHR